MPNPSLLICDSDVLVQLFLANQVQPLRDLKSLYGVQPAIVEEVDLEMRWLGPYGARFVLALDKALKSGLIVKLDKALFQSLLGVAPIGASWANFQSLGAQYLGLSEKGEAYCHAAGVTLHLPVASDDFRAIEVFEFQMKELPAPVIRSFDLLVFSVESGCLSLPDCEKVRSDLLKAKRWIPPCFRNSSIRDGMADFKCRLLDSTKAPPEAKPPVRYSDPLFIEKSRK